MKPLRIPIRVVFYKEGSRWVAHCLEFDLCGDGTTRKNALKQLNEHIAVQIKDSIANNNPANLFCPAESEFFRMFAEGEDIAVGKVEVEVDNIEIEDTTTREYREMPSRSKGALTTA